MTNGAGHMRLDERAHEAAALALNERANKKYNFYYVAKAESLDLSEAAITAYVSSTVPGDVRGLIKRLEMFWIGLPEEDAKSPAIALMLEAAAALLTLSAENAELKARLNKDARQ